MSEIVFALDIGTQSVSGILLEKNDKQFKVIDYHIEQHQERSMLDGQIQHVIEVADVISNVKRKLEERHGPLEDVCVAAAGRALKTVKTKKSVSITDQPLTSIEAVNHLELSAVQQAQLTLVKEDGQQFSNYHCVGFSVLHYYLDGERIGSLIDQTGEEASVEVITTFLPKVVIESLLAALERANLTMRALTLEPIAAIHVLVPQSMRRLNVVLIDIGAGTSDIAISNDGTVTAYGMVPVAGDEITEAISDHYLLDFKEAESAKQQVVNEKSVNVHDILGFETTITYDELTEHISERTDNLAQLLGEEVLLLNAEVPQAVMLIGGGSMTPDLTAKLANYLKLPKNRVAIRGVDGIAFLDKENQKLLPDGPGFVTPIGIAISATQNPLHYTNIYVNDQLVLMFRTKTLTIGDCLVQAGIDISKYYGKIALSRIAEINGSTVTLRGAYGEPPLLTLNGKDTTVNQHVEAEDCINLSKGKDGEEPHISIKEMLGQQEKSIPFLFEGRKEKLTTTYLVNNKETSADYIIQDKDKITGHYTVTIIDFLNDFYPEKLQQDKESFKVIVNNRSVYIKQGRQQFLLNGKPALLSSNINENDELTIKAPESVTVDTLLQQLDKMRYHSVKVSFNEKPVILSRGQTTVFRGDTALNDTSTIQTGDILNIKEEPVKSFIFQDIFRHVEIDMTNKSSYQLMINEEPAGFHDEISHGDQLKIIWD